jgi:glutamyl-tRNA(Gln) amidotransferase subunit D
MLDMAQPGIGDKVKIKTRKASYEGILMPRSELSDKEHIVLKLDSGYNIGISKQDISKIEQVPESRKTRAPKVIVKAGKGLPKISVVSTGGTITSKVDYKTGGVSPFKTGEELLAGMPKLAEIVQINDIKQPFSLLSEDISHKDWSKIAKEVYSELKKDTEGVIVTHGTDTLHYTSAALSFMIEGLNKPIAVVGAQRSADRGSFDGLMNMLCATHYCLSDIAEVAIVMHAGSSDEYCIASQGTKVRKMHTSRRDAFRPINDEPIAKIWPDGNVVMTGTQYNERSSGNPKLLEKVEEKVALIHSYPGARPEILEHYIDKKYKGIIIAGTGFGHVATQPLDTKESWLKAVTNTVDSGIFVGMTSQALYGTTDSMIYSAGRLLKNAGVTYLKDILPETAYVKLAWALGNFKRSELEEKMLENISGEINERIQPKSFLY